MRPETTLVIVNPAARGGWVEKRWPELEGALRAQLGEVRFVKTARSGDAVRLAAEAAREGVETLVSYGGDGTHSEVCHGLMQRPADERPALGILHAGTGGDFRRMLRDSDDLARAAAVIAEGPPEPIDVGLVRYVGDTGAEESRFFLNIASMGMGGLVDRLVNRSRKTLGGKATFAMATLRANATFHPPRVRVVLDDVPFREVRISNVCVCNGRWAGGGMMFAPEARLADGLFDVVILEAASTLRSLPMAAKLYSGRHVGSELVTVGRAARVRVEALDDHPSYMDIDGEAPGTGPASFEVQPGAIRLIGAREGFR